MHHVRLLLVCLCSACIILLALFRRPISCKSDLCAFLLWVLNGCASCVQCTPDVVVLLFGCALAHGVSMCASSISCSHVLLPWVLFCFICVCYCSRSVPVCSFFLMFSCSDSALVLPVLMCALLLGVLSLSVFLLWVFLYALILVCFCAVCNPALGVLLLCHCS
jgi:hypothetical protein